MGSLWPIEARVGLVLPSNQEVMGNAAPNTGLREGAQFTGLARCTRRWMDGIFAVILHSVAGMPLDDGEDRELTMVWAKVHRRSFISSVQACICQSIIRRCTGYFTRSQAWSRLDAKVLCARGGVKEVIRADISVYLVIGLMYYTGALLLVSDHDAERSRGVQVTYNNVHKGTHRGSDPSPSLTGTGAVATGRDPAVNPSEPLFWRPGTRRVDPATGAPATAVDG
ncbi:hypothetical protein C8F04DRAFT_1339109 [Mycena alexandri]|uniref:Uncharacterized protein n=1 Tax=Mycena alexandri TaxID=1745969 RepID=A0AAD6X5J8_9AGAR|nr:hypothetical protein C8F04DRAFT_1339109 [Mycena alexandri]